MLLPCASRVEFGGRSRTLYTTGDEDFEDHGVER